MRKGEKWFIIAIFVVWGIAVIVPPALDFCPLAMFLSDALLALDAALIVIGTLHLRKN